MSLPIKRAIIVHGGAWRVEDEQLRQLCVDGVRAAAMAGYEVLQNKSALDAVEAAVRILEDNPAFNSGTGSSINIEGDITMDAAIMDGASLRSGAIGYVREIQHPISLARLVMHETAHSFLVGDGAQQFAKKMGIQSIPQKNLVSTYSAAFFEQYKEKINTPAQVPQNRQAEGSSIEGRSDTVGAVAIDVNGNIATGNSTGGMTGKMRGRLGDSPLVGCGCYADNSTLGVSATGYGEQIISMALASRVSFLAEYEGLSAQEACNRALTQFRKRFNVEAGLIAIDHKGSIGVAHISDHMSWSSVVDGDQDYGIDNRLILQ